MYSYEVTRTIGGEIVETEKFETDDKNLGVNMLLRLFKTISPEESKIKIFENNEEYEFSGGTGGERI